MNILPESSAFRAEPVVGRQGAAAPLRLLWPRAARLLRHADFQRVYQQGRRHFGAHMTVFYLPRTAAGGPRIGFTVPRVLGGAVVRNRMRRRVREAVRASLAELAFSVDVVINPKRSALTADFAELGADVARAFAVIRDKELQRAGKEGKA